MSIISVLLTKYSKRKQAAYMFYCLLSFFPWNKFPFHQLTNSIKKSMAPAPVFRAQEVNWVDFFYRVCIKFRSTISEPLLISFPLLLPLNILIFVSFPFPQFYCTFLLYMKINLSILFIHLWGVEKEVHENFRKLAIYQNNFFPYYSP